MHHLAVQIRKTTGNSVQGCTSNLDIRTWQDRIAFFIAWCFNSFDSKFACSLGNPKISGELNKGQYEFGSNIFRLLRSKQLFKVLSSGGCTSLFNDSGSLRILINYQTHALTITSFLWRFVVVCMTCTCIAWRFSQSTRSKERLNAADILSLRNWLGYKQNVKIFPSS